MVLIVIDARLGRKQASRDGQQADWQTLMHDKCIADTPLFEILLWHKASHILAVICICQGESPAYTLPTQGIISHPHKNGMRGTDL